MKKKPDFKRSFFQNQKEDFLGESNLIENGPGTPRVATISLLSRAPIPTLDGAQPCSQSMLFSCEKGDFFFSIVDKAENSHCDLFSGNYEKNIRSKFWKQFLKSELFPYELR